jgi:hypothetical protein
MKNCGRRHGMDGWIDPSRARIDLVELRTGATRPYCWPHLSRVQVAGRHGLAVILRTATDGAGIAIMPGLGMRACVACRARWLFPMAGCNASRAPGSVGRKTRAGSWGVPSRHADTSVGAESGGFVVIADRRDHDRLLLSASHLRCRYRHNASGLDSNVAKRGSWC